ncbi:Sodium/hydrogen exchanger 8 [Triticum urartu]|uniref:Sodium/hydrogen exchanger 8 n=1 Tax=Triticum urartu TaxID=4572 RepID=M7Z3V1_TRIUA|nr:Sodium/hydrogen exchanger 8 [Triticum urartu]
MAIAQKIGSIVTWANINPDLLLAAFLPALLFESAFSMEAHQIKKCMAQMLLLAGPGVLMSTFLLGTALKLTSPYDWNWETSLLLGGLLSATDPVAVVAVLKELGTSKKLSTIIEGESLMNDGVALGLAFAIISLLWLGFTFNDTILEMTLTLAVSYIAFYTVQDALKYSGFDPLRVCLIDGTILSRLKRWILQGKSFPSTMSIGYGLVEDPLGLVYEQVILLATAATERLTDGAENKSTR